MGSNERQESAKMKGNDEVAIGQHKNLTMHTNANILGGVLLDECSHQTAKV